MSGQFLDVALNLVSGVPNRARPDVGGFWSRVGQAAHGLDDHGTGFTGFRDLDGTESGLLDHPILQGIIEPLGDPGTQTDRAVGIRGRRRVLVETTWAGIPELPRLDEPALGSRSSCSGLSIADPLDQELLADDLADETPVIVVPDDIEADGVTPVDDTIAIRDLETVVHAAFMGPQQGAVVVQPGPIHDFRDLLPGVVVDGTPAIQLELVWPGFHELGYHSPGHLDGLTHGEVIAPLDHHAFNGVKQ